MRRRLGSRSILMVRPFLLPHLWLLAVPCGALLSSPPASQSSSPRPLERVAIIGSGIAGLTLTHALASLLPDVSVSVFDGRPGLDPTVGAGIQLNGGLKVLGDIRPSLQKAVLQAGVPIQRIRSQSPQDGPLLDLDLQRTVQQAGVTELLQPDGTVLWTSIMRGTLQQTLHDTLEQRRRRNLFFRKTLSQIRVGDNGEAYCGFADGSEYGPFDLVVGCDGIKSAVKEYIDRGAISLQADRREGKAAGLYTGIRIRYAVQRKAAKKTTPANPVTFAQYFGDGCYCLDGTYGASNAIAKSVFAIFLDENYFGPFQRKPRNEEIQENADWSQDKVLTDKMAKERMIQQLKAANLAEESLLSTIEKADQFFELGVYSHNPFCSWYKPISGSKGAYTVLCGDAAHALPPFLGQGSNQAIQDAYCLAKRLAEYNQALAQQEKTATLQKYLREYESIRWMPNFQIFWKASFLGYLETGGFDGVYSTFRNAFFKTMAVIGVARRVLLSAAKPKV